MDITLEKKKIRKEILSLRKSFSEIEVTEKSERIFQNFQDNFGKMEHGIVHIFQSISANREPDTKLFLKYFDSTRWEIAVPVIIEAENRLKHLMWNGDVEMKLNRWGIAEPIFESKSFKASDFDMILVPLLGFDAEGNRLGYGKGYYDRFLVSTPKNCLKIGLAFEISKIEGRIPTDAFDFPLDFVITEKQVYSFSKKSIQS